MNPAFLLLLNRLKIFVELQIETNQLLIAFSLESKIGQEYNRGWKSTLKGVCHDDH